MLRGNSREKLGHTSFDPRPNPETTLPFMRRGKGGSGPDSGPIIEGLGSFDDILSMWLS